MQRDRGDRAPGKGTRPVPPSVGVHEQVSGLPPFSPTWLRIDRGDGVREVTFPDRFDPYAFTDGRVWGVGRDALDVASVAWVEVPGQP